MRFFRPLINNGGIIALARLITIGPLLLAWTVGGELWHHDARPWLSRSLVTLGHKLA